MEESRQEDVPMVAIPVKPGYQTSENIHLVIQQLFGFAVALGVLSKLDAEHLSAMVYGLIVAGGIVAFNGMAVAQYMRSRYALKSQAMAGGEHKPFLWLAIPLLFFCGPALAADAPGPRVVKTDTHYFGLFRQYHKTDPAPSQPQTDPALAAQLHAMSLQAAQQHAELMALLSRQGLQVPPSVIVYPPASPPSYVPPTGGPPVYQPPVGGPPVYSPPSGGPPAYTPPVGGPPVYAPPAGGQPVYTPPVLRLGPPSSNTPLIHIYGPAQPPSTPIYTPPTGGTPAAPPPVYTPPAAPPPYMPPSVSSDPLGPQRLTTHRYVRALAPAKE